jgi:hypothetical protein
MALRIIGTFANRILTAVLNFAIVLITAKLFGAEGRGEISLLVLSATIIQILSGIAGGGALTFLAPPLSLQPVVAYINTMVYRSKLFYDVAVTEVSSYISRNRNIVTDVCFTCSII